MLRWIEDYFARRATIRRLGEWVTPEAVDEILKGDCEIGGTEPREIEFMLILLSSHSPKITEKHLAGLVSIVKEKDWLVLSETINLIYVANGLFHTNSNASPLEIATIIHKELDDRVRIIYGRARASVGNVGSNNHYTFTALLPQFPAILEHLCVMPMGTYEEFQTE